MVSIRPYSIPAIIQRVCTVNNPIRVIALHIKPLNLSFPPLNLLMTNTFVRWHHPIAINTLSDDLIVPAD